MKRGVYVFLVLALSGCLLGCGGEGDPSPGGDDRPLPVGEAGRAELWKFEIMKEDRASDMALQFEGPLTRAASYAPEGVLIQPGVGAIRGPEAIQEAYNEAFSTGASDGLTWLPEWAEVSVAGDLGYTVGYYQEGNIQTSGVRSWWTGMYLSVWRKQPDGTWKVEANIRVPIEEPLPVSNPG